jgi:hypothetical protein
LEELAVGQRKKKVINASLFHNTLYFTQPLLLKHKQAENEGQDFSKQGAAFTQPQDTVYKDKNGKFFVLKPGGKLYRIMQAQDFKDGAGEAPTDFQKLVHIIFISKDQEEIAKLIEGETTEVRDFKEVLENFKASNTGFITQGEQPN